MAASNSLQASVIITLMASLFVAVSDASVCYPRCNLGSVCCRGVCVITSCRGRYCVTSSDCSTAETCCNFECVDQSGCVGQSCTADGECDYGEKCCDDVCAATQTCKCVQDSECSTGDICCHGTCAEKGDCSASSSYKNPAFLVVGTVFGSLVLIPVISIFVYLIYRRRWKIPRDGSGQYVTASVTPSNNTAQRVPASRNASGNFYCPIPSAPADNTI